METRPKNAKTFLKKNPVTELRIDTFLFFFLKCPPLFIKLHSSHDEIRRGSAHPLQILQSYLSRNGPRYSRSLGQDKGNTTSRHGRLHPSRMALSSQAEIGVHRKRIFPAEKHRLLREWLLRSSSPIHSRHLLYPLHRDQLHLFQKWKSEENPYPPPRPGF